MNPIGREPRWKQIIKKQDRELSKDYSQTSKRSNKYTPKKSQGSSEAEFSLTHLQGNSLQYEQIPMKGSLVGRVVREEGSVVHYPQRNQGSEGGRRSIISRINRVDSGGSGGSSLDQGASAVHYPKVVDVIRHNKRENQPQREAQNSFPLKLDSKLSAEENFRQCLKYLEKSEKDLIGQKRQIQRKLYEQQDQFERAKTRLYQKFQTKSSQFEDEGLKKLIHKYLQTKNKPGFSSSKRSFRANQNEKSNEKYVQGQDPAGGRNCEKNRIHSAYYSNFNRIVSTIETMKQGLQETRVP